MKLILTGTIRSVENGINKNIARKIFPFWQLIAISYGDCELKSVIRKQPYNAWTAPPATLRTETLNIKWPCSGISNFVLSGKCTQRSEPCQLNWRIIYEPAFLFIRVRRERVSPFTGIPTAISSLCTCHGYWLFLSMKPWQNSSTRDRRTPTWSPGGPGPHLAQSSSTHQIEYRLFSRSISYENTPREIT